MSTRSGALAEVVLRRVPVDVWLRSQEQSDALMREFALIASDARSDPHGGHVPVRLLQLVETLSAGYAEFTGDQQVQLIDAADAGRSEVDLVYRLPAEVGRHAQELGRLLDEADAYCAAGEHLLTLQAPEELVRFRWWFLDQFTGQVAGRPPVAWPDYRR